MNSKWLTESEAKSAGVSLARHSIHPGAKVRVYKGQNYGCIHTVTSVSGDWLVCRYGYDAVTAHFCDVEYVEAGACVKEAA